MDTNRRKPPKTPSANLREEEMNHIVAQARREQQERMKGYREQSLRIHPWVCARCGREFTARNLRLLTVHHKDHNHDYNPSDGSNWENLCIYCHENEHSRYIDHVPPSGGIKREEPGDPATHKPFAALAELMKKGG